MRSLRLLSIVAACVGVVGSANAVILFSQPSDTAISNVLQSGEFSDALSSGGYFYGQTIADNFTVGSGGWNVTGIRFWGSSENEFEPDLSNFSDIEINIMSPLGTVNHTWTVSLANLTTTATGNTNLNGGIEYEFLFNVNFSLAAGAHWINIGSINNSAIGDAFAWSGSNQGDAVRAFNLFSGWQTEQASNMAFEFIGPSNVVPEPFTMALGLGAAGAYIRRRRRK